MIEGIEVLQLDHQSAFSTTCHTTQAPSPACGVQQRRIAKASPKAPANRKSDSLSAPRSDSASLHS